MAVIHTVAYKCFHSFFMATVNKGPYDVATVKGILLIRTDPFVVCIFEPFCMFSYRIDFTWPPWCPAHGWFDQVYVNAYVDSLINGSLQYRVAERLAFLMIRTYACKPVGGIIINS